MNQSASPPSRFRSLAGAFRRAPLLTSFAIACRIFERLIRRTRHGNVNFYPNELLPWAVGLEAGWKQVRTELDGVLSDLRSLPNAQDEYHQGELTQDDKWKTFTLIRFGRRNESNCARCPETARLVEQIPNLRNAFFSIIAGHKHIKAHRGAFAGLLNCHLGLLIPTDPSQCRIRVGSEIRSWQEGRLLVFDDTKEHEVWNDSDQIRVVMIMYTLRPLPAPLSALNRLMVVGLTWFFRHRGDY